MVLSSQQIEVHTVSYGQASPLGLAHSVAALQPAPACLRVWHNGPDFKTEDIGQLKADLARAAAPVPVHVTHDHQNLGFGGA